MPRDNSLNPAAGRDFEVRAARVMGAVFGVSLLLDHALPIGEPPKMHKFDFGTDSGSHVGEAKCYTWTETGNVPSAKLGFLNQAVFYLSFLPDTMVRFVVMPRSLHPRRHESLAEYWYRTDRHLLQGVRVFEIEDETDRVFEMTSSGSVLVGGGGV
jgi:hypothetical protein